MLTDCTRFKVIYTKYSDIYDSVNNVDPDQTAPKEQSYQGLHCLQNYKKK